jgi:hypothetical protein
MTSNPGWVVLSVALLSAGSVAAQQPPEIRRVVTKLDASGKAVVMIDEHTRLTAPRPPNYAANIWVTDKNLPDFSSTDDRGKTKVGLAPRSRARSSGSSISRPNPRASIPPT